MIIIEVEYNSYKNSSNNIYLAVYGKKHNRY